MATSASTVIAAMAAKARREVRTHFTSGEAFVPERAIAYDPPTTMHRRQFDSLVGRGIVRATGDGRYWLDRDAERAEDERRRAAAFLMLKILLIGFAIAIAVAGILSIKR